MKKIKSFCLIVFTFLSVYSMSVSAEEGDYLELPFNKILCEGKNTSMVIFLNQYRRSSNSGPAILKINGEQMVGSWSLIEEPDGTRLTGFYHLVVKSGKYHQNELGNFIFKSLYSPEHQFTSSSIYFTDWVKGVHCKEFE